MRLSVVIPVYNAERYLRRCLDSVAAQTFTDMEVLLMNGKSLLFQCIMFHQQLLYIGQF